MNTEIHINHNPLGSKTLGLAITKSPPEIAFNAATEEVLNGCKLNYLDLWLYIAALELLANALKTQIDGEQLKSYNTLIQKLNIVTISRGRDTNE